MGTFSVGQNVRIVTISGLGSHLFLIGEVVEIVKVSVKNLVCKNPITEEEWVVLYNEIEPITTK